MRLPVEEVSRLTCLININKNDPALETANEKLRDEIVELLIQIMYETGGARKATMPLATVAFNVTGNATEFRRQIAMQQAALNTMKVGEWQKNRARFVGFGRANRSEDSDKKRIEAFTEAIVNDVNSITQLSTADKTSLLKFADSDGKIISPTGKSLAASFAKRLIESRSARGEAVLHSIDQVAGGSAIVYGDKTGVLGDASVNSAIGSQWKDRIMDVDAKAANVDPSADVKVKLNA